MRKLLLFPTRQSARAALASYAHRLLIKHWRILAFAFPVLLLNSLNGANAAEWVLAKDGNAHAYTVRTDTPIESGELISIRYKCDIATLQQIDVVFPSEIFDSKFKGAKRIGIVLTSDDTSKFPDGAIFGGLKLDQERKGDGSADSAGAVFLSHKVEGTKVMEIAKAFAMSKRPVVIGLFESGRKAPIKKQDILLEFKIPVTGSTKAFQEAYSGCELLF